MSRPPDNIRPGDKLAVLGHDGTWRPAVARSNGGTCPVCQRHGCRRRGCGETIDVDQLVDGIWWRTPLHLIERPIIRLETP